MDIRSLSGLALAYMGDSAYEVFIRQYLIEKGITKPSVLHKRATKYVSAKAQASIMQYLLDNNKLSEEEVLIYKRGRNSKSYTSAKNADIITYRVATGFETLVGYLYLSEQINRLNHLFKLCIDFVEKKNEQH